MDEKVGLGMQVEVEVLKRLYMKEFVNFFKLKVFWGLLA